MPKISQTYILYRVFGDNQEMFSENSIKPNTPKRFALVREVRGAKNHLEALCEADALLDWLALVAMMNNGVRVVGSSIYYTDSQFAKFAKENLSVKTD